MSLLQRPEILDRLQRNDATRIFIDPLLDDGQVGAVTVDLRLGPDFLVSLLTRRPSIEIAPSESGRHDIGSYFRVTRREVGDKFVLYPGQIVLATTLEYVAIPGDLFADVISRSSYSRLGIHLNTTVQPGFRGVVSLELLNHSNNPVELVVGTRLVQVRFHQLAESVIYQTGQPNRKYLGNVRPAVSRAQYDSDLAVIAKL